MAFAEELGKLSSFGHVNEVTQKADEVVAKFRAVCRRTAFRGDICVRWTSYDYYSICGRNCQDRVSLSEIDKQQLQEPLKELIHFRLRDDGFETLRVSKVPAQQGKLAWQLNILASWRAGLRWGADGVPRGAGEVLPQSACVSGTSLSRTLGGRSSGSATSMREARLALLGGKSQSAMGSVSQSFPVPATLPERARAGGEGNEQSPGNTFSSDNAQLSLCDERGSAKRAKSAAEDATMQSSSSQAFPSSRSSNLVALSQLVEMGFDESRAREQLTKAGNDVARALESLLAQ